MTSVEAGWTIREFTPQDAASWVRCRALSFLGSSYYDDVSPQPTTFEGAAIRLVAVHPRPPRVRTPGAEQVIGIIDVELFEPDAAQGETHVTATIDTIAVHPDHLREGIAGALLQEAVRRLEPTGALTLDAWTRTDEAATAWYLQSGFTENYRYVHVHKSWDEEPEGWSSPAQLSTPVLAFAHGRTEDLDALRRTYRRTYECVQYLRRL